MGNYSIAVGKIVYSQILPSVENVVFHYTGKFHKSQNSGIESYIHVLA